jgi:hypothetical protein
MQAASGRRSTGPCHSRDWAGARPARRATCHDRDVAAATRLAPSPPGSTGGWRTGSDAARSSRHRSSAYRALDEGLTEFFSTHDSSYARAGRLLVHAASLDSAFNLPLLWALYAFGNSGESVRFDSVMRVLESRRERMPPFDRALLDAHAASARGDNLGEYDALRRLVAIVPQSEWV